MIRIFYVKLIFLEKINHKTLLGSRTTLYTPQLHVVRGSSLVAATALALTLSHSLIHSRRRLPTGGDLFSELPGIIILLVKGWHVFCRLSSSFSGGATFRLATEWERVNSHMQIETQQFWGSPSTEGRDQTQDPSSSLHSTATLHFGSHWGTDYCVDFLISGVALGGDFSVDCAVIGFLCRPLSVSLLLPSQRLSAMPHSSKEECVRIFFLL